MLMHLCVWIDNLWVISLAQTELCIRIDSLSTELVPSVVFTEDNDKAVINCFYSFIYLQ